MTTRKDSEKYRGDAVSESDASLESCAVPNSKAVPNSEVLMADDAPTCGNMDENTLGASSDSASKRDTCGDALKKQEAPNAGQLGSGQLGSGQLDAGQLGSGQLGSGQLSPRLKLLMGGLDPAQETDVDWQTFCQTIGWQNATPLAADYEEKLAARIFGGGLSGSAAEDYDAAPHYLATPNLRGGGLRGGGSGFDAAGLSSQAPRSYRSLRPLAEDAHAGPISGTRIALSASAANGNAERRRANSYFGATETSRQDEATGAFLNGDFATTQNDATQQLVAFGPDSTARCAVLDEATLDRVQGERRRPYGWLIAAALVAAVALLGTAAARWQDTPTAADTVPTPAPERAAPRQQPEMPQRMVEQQPNDDTPVERPKTPGPGRAVMAKHIRQRGPAPQRAKAQDALNPRHHRQAAHAPSDATLPNQRRALTDRPTTLAHAGALNPVGELGPTDTLGLSLSEPSNATLLSQSGGYGHYAFSAHTFRDPLTDPTVGGFAATHSAIGEPIPLATVTPSHSPQAHPDTAAVLGSTDEHQEMVAASPSQAPWRAATNWYGVKMSVPKEERLGVPVGVRVIAQLDLAAAGRQFLR